MQLERIRLFRKCIEIREKQSFINPKIGIDLLSQYQWWPVPTRSGNGVTYLRAHLYSTLQSWVHLYHELGIAGGQLGNDCKVRRMAPAG